MPPVCPQADAPGAISESPQVALLIDAENISYRYADAVIAAAEAYGDVAVRFAFGDWSSPHLKGWVPRMKRLGLAHGPRFVEDPGKNVTDANLMIVGMDLLYADEIDVICIASGDADFAPLAGRLTSEQTLEVVGIGPHDAARVLVRACDHFEWLSGPVEPASDAALDLLIRAFEQLRSGQPFELLSRLGNTIRTIMPGFRCRDHGCGKLWQLVDRYPGYFRLESDPDQPTVRRVYLVS